jgi:serine protease Do
MDFKKNKLGAGFFITVSTAFLVIFGMSAVPAMSEPGSPGSFAKLVEEVSPSVVNISVEKVTEVGGNQGTPFHSPSPYGGEDPFQDFFKRFFGDNMPRKFKERGLGSGFIIDKKGYILTNNHVVEGTDKIEVTLNDDKEYDAKIIGRDPKTDIALIKIDADLDVEPLELGDSEKIKVGDWVVAIGSPFGLGHTVTAGIVSAKYRKIGMGAYDDFIQTDASINPGNSGGPLLSVDGKVIGINSVIFSQSGGNVGIGFAIPVNMVKDLLPQLKKGKVVRGWLGVMIQEITPELKDTLGLKDEKGALISDVVKDSPAEKAGLERGDVIISMDGKKIGEMNDLPYMVAKTPVGNTIKLKIIRGGKELTKDVTIAEAKEDNTAVEENNTKQEGPQLGMSLTENSKQYERQYNLPDYRGLVVTGVMPGGPAAQAGIQTGDIILELDRKPIESMQDFRNRLDKYKKGETMLFLIKRQSGTLYLTLKLEE